MIVDGDGSLPMIGSGEVPWSVTGSEVAQEKLVIGHLLGLGG